MRSAHLQDELSPEVQKAHPRAEMGHSALYSAEAWVVQAIDIWKRYDSWSTAQRASVCPQAHSLNLGAFERLQSQAGLAQPIVLILWFAHIYYS